MITRRARRRQVSAPARRAHPPPGAGAAARIPRASGDAALRPRLSRFPLRVRKTFRNILAEYGTTALVVYLAIFAVVLGGFWLGIVFGWRPSSVAGNAGAFTAAYLATKVTQPLRIAATLVLTPLVARAWERLTGRAPASRAAEPDAAADPARARTAAAAPPAER